MQPDIQHPSQLLKQFTDPAVDNFSTRAGTIAAIRRQCTAQGLALPTQHAYVLATTAWETNRTFQPVREAYWRTEDWRGTNLRYYPYYGRGYVQLTWERNYRRYGDLLGLPLVSTPDLAMQPSVAAFVLVHGFKHGIFTGRSLEQHVNATTTDFIGARRCINGTDRSAEIAKLAQQFVADIAKGVV